MRRNIRTLLVVDKVLLEEPGGRVPQAQTGVTLETSTSLSAKTILIPLLPWNGLLQGEEEVLAVFMVNQEQAGEEALEANLAPGLKLIHTRRQDQMARHIPTTTLHITVGLVPLLGPTACQVIDTPSLSTAVAMDVMEEARSLCNETISQKEHIRADINLSSENSTLLMRTWTASMSRENTYWYKIFRSKTLVSSNPQQLKS